MRPIFQFTADLARAWKDSAGTMHLLAVASDDQVDLYWDRMGRAALEGMAAQCRAGIDILPNHRDALPISRTVDGAVVGSEVDGRKVLNLVVDIEVDARHAEMVDLWEAVKAGTATTQLSIGGMINLENPAAITHERTAAGNVRVIHDLALDHIALVRGGNAGNPRTAMLGAVLRDVFGEDSDAAPVAVPVAATATVPMLAILRDLEVRPSDPGALESALESALVERGAHRLGEFEVVRREQQSAAPESESESPSSPTPEAQAVKPNPTTEKDGPLRRVLAQRGAAPETVTAPTPAPDPAAATPTAVEKSGPGKARELLAAFARILEPKVDATGTAVERVDQVDEALVALAGAEVKDPATWERLARACCGLQQILLASDAVGMDRKKVLLSLPWEAVGEATEAAFKSFADSLPAIVAGATSGETTRQVVEETVAAAAGATFKDLDGLGGKLDAVLKGLEGLGGALDLLAKSQAALTDRVARVEAVEGVTHVIQDTAPAAAPDRVYSGFFDKVAKRLGHPVAVGARVEG